MDYKSTELETLKTFQEEIPSQYFSHLDKDEYDRYVAKMEYLYRNHFKFPPKMFDGAELIDFGAGTGENTIYLANWGAKCTLVEMNYMSQDISKEVFAKYSNNPDDHNFVLSSIFEYNPKEDKQYDIVHCRGVLSHTSEKEKAFQIISKYVKPGGYIIFGDPNKAGGFQNMLQRYAVYSYATTPDEMVDVSEILFKEDIDRSVASTPRTRRAIIFDRWVIQSQDDPSVEEVHSWMNEAGLQIYSAYPNVLMPIRNDSYLHNNKYDPYEYKNLFSIPELSWMMHTEEDTNVLPGIDDSVGDFASAFKNLTSYMENFQSDSKLDIGEFSDLAASLKSANTLTPVLKPFEEKLNVFLKESVDFIKVVESGKLEDVRSFVESTEHLFKGACGVRHADFIGYKPE